VGLWHRLGEAPAQQKRPPGLSRQGRRFFVVLGTRPRSTLLGGERGSRDAQHGSFQTNLRGRWSFANPDRLLIRRPYPCD
jgi:hypothetical protein